MKSRLILIVALLSASLCGQAQLTLDKVYNNSLTSTKINSSEFKYYLMDVQNSQCRIYNTDHELWKTIPISLPSNYYLFDIKFVAQYLFNTDEVVELWYSAYEWVTTGTSTGYYRYISKVINESGAELANVPGGVYAFVIQTGAEIYKLAVYAYDNSTPAVSVQTYLYSLPNPSVAIDYVSAMLEDPWPNPAHDYINLPVDVHNGNNIIQIFAISGQKIMETRVQNGPVFRLNTRGISPGVYIYRILQNGNPSENKQFIIRKN